VDIIFRNILKNYNFYYKHNIKLHRLMLCFTWTKIHWDEDGSLSRVILQTNTKLLQTAFSVSVKLLMREKLMNCSSDILNYECEEICPIAIIVDINYFPHFFLWIIKMELYGAVVMQLQSSWYHCFLYKHYVTQTILCLSY
jgi:hypothetical protein